MARNTGNRWGEGSRAYERWRGNPWDMEALDTIESAPDRKQTEPWPENLDTARDVEYLSPAEKGIIFEYNKVRFNPTKYLQEELIPLRSIYKDKKITIAGKWERVTKEGVAGLEGCIQTLEYCARYAPMSLLLPFDGFALVAKLHAEDHSKSGLRGHLGSDGRDTEARILAITEPIANTEYKVRENIDYGPWQDLAKWVVFLLLLDDGQ